MYSSVLLWSNTSARPSKVGVPKSLFELTSITLILLFDFKAFVMNDISVSVKPEHLINKTYNFLQLSTLKVTIRLS